MSVPTSEVGYTIATTRREKTTKFVRTSGGIGGKKEKKKKNYSILHIISIAVFVA